MTTTLICLLITISQPDPSGLHERARQVAEQVRTPVVSGMDATKDYQEVE